MPSVGTSVLTTRVKNETSTILKNTAEANGLSVSQLLDVIAGAIEDGRIDIYDGEVGSELKEFDMEREVINMNRLMDAFENKGYPESAIQRAIDQMIVSINDSPRYNPKKSREDWGA